MRKFKKILAVCVCFLLAVTGAACGRSNIETDERGVIVEDNKVYVGNYSEKELIKVAYFDVGYGDRWIYEQAKDFVYENQEYAIFLTADSSLVTNYSNKLEAGKNLSDLYITPNADWQAFSASGWLEPLDDVYKAKPDGEDGLAVGDKLIGQYKTAGIGTRQGEDHYYVLPWTHMTTGICYNVELFERYGIDPPETMAEFENVCNTIIEKSTAEGKRIAPIVFPGKIGGYLDYLGMSWWLQQVGVEGMKQYFAFDTVEVYNPENPLSAAKVRALQEFEKYFGSGEDGLAKYCLSGSMSKDSYTAQLDFINGNAAMIVNANWLETEMEEMISEMDFKMKIMTVPFIDGAQKDKSGNYIDVNYAAAMFDIMSIPAKASNKDGAKKFMTFMIRDDMLRQFTLDTGTKRPFTYDVEDLKSQMTPFQLSVMEIYDKTGDNTYFDYPTGPRRYMATKFVAQDPYSAILAGTDPVAWAANEYEEAKVRWDKDWAIS